MSEMPLPQNPRDLDGIPSSPQTKAIKPCETNHQLGETEQVTSYLPSTLQNNATAASWSEYFSGLSGTPFAEPLFELSPSPLMMESFTANISSGKNSVQNIQGTRFRIPDGSGSGPSRIEEAGLFNSLINRSIQSNYKRHFVHKSSRRRHIRNFHPQEIPCPLCGWFTRRKHLLLKHLRDNHSLLASASELLLSNSQINSQQLLHPKTPAEDPNNNQCKENQDNLLLATKEHRVIQSRDSSSEKSPNMVEISKSQYTQQRFTMWSIVTVVVVLRRYMKIKISSLKENLTGSQILLQGRISTIPMTKNANVALRLLQSKDSSSSSDTSSVNSLEIDVTEENSEEAEILWCKKESDSYIILSQPQVRNLMALAQRALSKLSSETSSKSLAAIETLFQSWASQISPSKHTVDDRTSPACDFSQVEDSFTNKTSDNKSQKRHFNEDQNQPPNGNDSNSGKSQKLSGKLDNRCCQMWACPYYQREPHRYCLKTELGDFRKCAKSPGFSEVHRVKDHIYKRHSHKYCDRCYPVFGEDAELILHRRSSPACDVKLPQQIEGLNNEQRALLKSRDRSSKSKEERWNTIYKICFPDDQVIPSPYYVHYSRQFAELRRQVLDIIQEEAQSPNSFDPSRLIQRARGVFDANETAGGLAFPRPVVLTTFSSTMSESFGSQSNTL